MRLFDSGGGLILVTGAAGFIGANLCRNLLEMGCNVIGVDNLTDYYDVALKHHRLAALHHYPHFQLKQIDLANQASVRGLFEDNDFKLVFGSRKWKNC